jgi:hypothetical protein
MSVEFFVKVAEQEGMAGDAISAADQAHQATPISAHKEVSDQKHHSRHRNLTRAYFERLDCLMFVFFLISCPGNLARVEFRGVPTLIHTLHKVAPEVVMEGGL